MPTTEFSTPVSTGADEAVTIQKRARLSAIHVIRGSAITIESQIAHVDAATGNDRVVNSGPSTVRPLSNAVLAEKIGGTGATLGQTLTKLGDFGMKWRAEDVAAEAARIAALNP